MKLTAHEQSVTVSGRADDAGGVAGVTVNGQAAALDENGNFSAELLLKVGDNSIVVTALDLSRNQATEQLTIVRKAGGVAARSATPVVTPSGKSYALVIGINNYRSITKLKTAVNDARDVAKVLKDQYGFETRLVLDDKATNAGILRELNELRKKLKAEDRLLIYYAGHGILDQTTDGSFWLPVDADPNDDTNWLDARRISDSLKRIAARQVLLVADSCYSGTLSRSLDIDLKTGEGRESYLRRLREKPSRILIASGGNEPVADSGAKGHSVFAAAFIDALQHPDKRQFTAMELVAGRLREAVAGKAEQTPECKVIRNSGHDAGDFVFEKVK